MGRFLSSHLSRSHQNSLLVLVNALAPVHVHVRADRGRSRMAQKKARRLLSPLHPRQPPSPPMQALASNTWDMFHVRLHPRRMQRFVVLQVIEVVRMVFKVSLTPPTIQHTYTTDAGTRTLSFSDVSSSCLISFSRASRIAYRVTARSASSIW